MLVLAGCATTPVSFEKETLNPITCSLPDERIGQMPQEIPIKSGDEYYYFNGVSDYFYSQKEAEDDAFKDAIKAITRYTGIDAMFTDKTIIASYGLSSEIIDPTIARQKLESIDSAANLSQIKTSQTYTEKYKCQAGKRKVSGYKVTKQCRDPGALVEKIIKKKEDYQTKILEKAQAANTKLVTATKLLNEANSIAVSDFNKAYKKYSETINICDELKAELQMDKELAPITKKADELIQAANQGKKKIVDDPTNIFSANIRRLMIDSKKFPLTVALAKINYENTDYSTKFSERLIEDAEKIMKDHSDLYIVKTHEWLQQQLSFNKISIDDVKSGKSKPESLASLQGLISIKYWVSGDIIKITVVLDEIGTGVLMGKEQFDLPKSMFPDVTEFMPANLELANWFKENSGTNEENTSVKIQVYPNKGDSAYYVEGDSITFHFKANKDCYVYLYHMDSEGVVQQLFPNNVNIAGGSDKNFVKSDKVYSIPDDMGCIFYAKGPAYGLEMVKVIASLQPIKELDVTAGKEMFRYIGQVGGKDAGNIRSIKRSIGTIARNERAESVTTLTTGKK
jgi:hypothetical protein